MHAFNYPSWNRIVFDRSRGTPLNEQLFEQLRRWIRDGIVAPGARLPPSRVMAEELGLSRNTVVLAYERLATEGYVARRIGAGTFVETMLPEDNHPRAETAVIPVSGPNALPAPSRRGQALLDMNLPAERIETYDLSAGVPALNEFPYDEFAQIASRRWREHASAHTGYDYSRGAPLLATRIAGYLAEAKAINCRPEQIIVIGNTLQAAALASHVLLDRGDTVLVEDPCHMPEIATLEAFGLVTVPAPLDRQGFDTEAAGVMVREARMAVVSPTEQWPFGCTMTADRRQKLLDWAADRPGWIFEDDSNSEIRWSGEAQTTLYARDPRRVIYTGSFNRMLAPGLRLAYLIAPMPLVEAFALAQRIFSFYAPLPDQALVADFMDQGRLASHLRRMRTIYRDRAACLTQCLRAKLRDGFDVPDVHAGLHLTVHAREPFDDVAVSRTLLQKGLDCPPLSRYARRETKPRGLVLGFGNTSVRRIPRCVDILAQTILEHG
ncbi:MULTISPECIES: PLP-dependent aminotransferase family protein [unclassified Mesorhizobium]|uniref:MocR-like pyridoxine biosynthesis transcription factor PdxR n=1 Tax=unclassified Mesorhizobium TaxID=325217 RepID=UPI0011277AFE|nr:MULTISPECIES: PLP-dependent aminotransferase family protein [unclassified Mesorhizobium]TPL53533.1 PLP-dependent aminotransferase family protein [Mesorhizobium sp. B2-4-2]TPN32784.1 PLP-dependent aminotransferase family protein [Mesorhizobium sp. B1-1-6]